MAPPVISFPLRRLPALWWSGAALALALAPLAPAQTISLTTLFSFDATTNTAFPPENTDGRQPGPLVDGGDGYLYGTCQYGGPQGYGTLFRVKYDGTGFAVLHDFGAGADGAIPPATLGLVISGTTIYGITTAGGSAGTDFSGGTVYTISTAGANYQVIQNFSSSGSTTDPVWIALSPGGSALAILCGTNGGGTAAICTLPTTATVATPFTLLHQFASNGSDGTGPIGIVYSPSGAAIYGAASSGGSNGTGTIFSVTVATESFTVVHDFSALASGANTDGADPNTAPVITPDGSTLYGIAKSGGTNGNGTVYSIALAGGAFTTLDSFTGGAADGGTPTALVLNGGAVCGVNDFGGAAGAGTLWRIALSAAQSQAATQHPGLHTEDAPTITVIGPSTAVCPIGGTATFEVEASEAGTGGSLAFESFAGTAFQGSGGYAPNYAFPIVNSIFYGAINIGGQNSNGQIYDGSIPAAPAGPGEFAYQWFGTNESGAAVAIAGATQSTLLLTGVVQQIDEVDDALVPNVFGGFFGGQLVFGPYYCVVSDPVSGATNQSSSAVIGVPAYFVAMPVAATYTVGSSQGLPEFSVQVGGSTPIAAHWYIDGNPVPGIAYTSITLDVRSGFSDTIDPDAPAVGTGQYLVTCTAENQYNEEPAVSNPVTLTVNAEPAEVIPAPGPSPLWFSSTPGNVAVEAGDVLTLSAPVSGNDVTYQWFLDGQPISGATSSTYSVDTFLPSNVGQYVCVATASSGAAIATPPIYAALSGGSPPTITAQPATQTYSVSDFGSVTATFGIMATGTGTLQYQWYFTPDGDSSDAIPVPSVSGGASATGTDLSVPFVAATIGYYYCVVSNNYGQAQSEMAALASMEDPPTILTEPSGATVTAGDSVSLTVTAAPSGCTYMWYDSSGNPISGATVSTDAAGSTLSIAQISPDQAGTWTSVVTDPTTGLSTQTASIPVNVNAAGGPAVETQPGAAGPIDVESGGTYALEAQGAATPTELARAVDPRATGNLSYQWQFNGRNIAGATDPVLMITRATAADAGVYDCVVTGPGGSTATNPAKVAVSSAAIPGYLVNISSRALVGSTGANALFAGFVSSGAAAKNLLLRGVGPGLAQFNVPGVLPDPILTLYNSSGGTLASNTAWGGTSVLMEAFSATGAFGLSPSSPDTALLEDLPAGSYSTQVTSQSGQTGVALVEVYDDDPSPPASHLVNISSRALVLSGQDILIDGFVIGGNSAQTILIRGIGPTLSSFGISNPLAQPTITLYNGQGAALATNSGWNGDPVLADVFTEVQAFSLPSGSTDAAMLVTLPPGNYSVEVTGPAGTSGVALAEIYAVP